MRIQSVGIRRFEDLGGSELRDLGVHESFCWVVLWGRGSEVLYLDLKLLGASSWAPLMGDCDHAWQKSKETMWVVVKTVVPF